LTGMLIASAINGPVFVTVVVEILIDMIWLDQFGFEPLTR
jgi:hypothetical protein